ncbi:hypothetical protein [Bartonella machadoae]|uniref:hypothetical protein n=1 Tax=Bartonella machadoae TaxID=2893471 RepID=UPI0035636501
MIGEFKGLCDAAMMVIVKTLLPRAEFACHDAVGTLALAICHSMHRNSLSDRLRVTA